MTAAVFTARRHYRYMLAHLHVSYTSTQLDFAVSFLKSHPDTRLVSIGLGANDVLLLRTQCADDPTCIALELPQVLAAVETNLATILGDLRAAGFKGAEMVVDLGSIKVALWADGRHSSTMRAVSG